MRRATARARHEFRRHVAAELRAELVRSYVALGWDLPDGFVLAEHVPRTPRLVPRGDYIGWTTVTDFTPTNNPPRLDRWRRAPKRKGERWAAAKGD